MSQACWLNGSLTDLTKVAVSVDTAAMRYALVVFDGCAAVAGAEPGALRALDLAAHLARFRRSCAGLDLELSYSDDELTAAVTEVARRHSAGHDWGIRLFGYSDDEGFSGATPARVCVFLRDMRGYAPDRPLTLAVADEPRPAGTELPRWVKATAHYPGARRAVARAHRAGCDDVVFRNEWGRVTESSRASLLVLRGDSLVAPPEEEGVLPGVTRELVGAVAARALGMTPVYRPLELAEVLASDGAVLCSSSLGAAVVGEIDGHALPREAAEALVSAYGRAARGATTHLDHVVTRIEVTP
jgi:branched-subunit amino acid aminotransferase/4-amino-4-deoxychorismate lyase